MQSSSTFIRISGPIPKVKTALINDYENIVAYSEQSQQSEVQVNRCGLLLIYLGGLRVGTTPGKLGNFYFNLSLETIFPACKLTQNCFININISFS